MKPSQKSLANNKCVSNTEIKFMNEFVTEQRAKPKYVRMENKFSYLLLRFSAHSAYSLALAPSL